MRILESLLNPVFCALRKIKMSSAYRRWQEVVVTGEIGEIAPTFLSSSTWRLRISLAKMKR